MGMVGGPGGMSEGRLPIFDNLLDRTNREPTKTRTSTTVVEVMAAMILVYGRVAARETKPESN